MIHNSKLRIGAFLIFILIVFFSAYFIGNFAPVVKSGEIMQDTFNKAGTGQQIFAFPLKQGEHQCSITVSDNINPDGTPSYLSVFTYNLNNADTQISDEQAGNYEGTFNVTGKGVNVPVVMHMQTVAKAEWNIQCAKV